MAKTSIYVVIPKNIPVPGPLIAVCKRYQIPLMRGSEVGFDSGWNVPGTRPGPVPCSDEPAPEPLVAESVKCFHRVVLVDYELGVEKCDNSACGHVFRKFEPIKHVCPEPDGVCGPRCTWEVPA